MSLLILPFNSAGPDTEDGELHGHRFINNV